MHIGVEDSPLGVQLRNSPLEGGSGGVREYDAMPRRKIIPYNAKLKELSRRLRNNSTLSEVLLWQQIKNRKIRGYRFLRQKPIDDYIVDFFCHELLLAIEIDGETHNYKAGKDQIRQDRLEALGIDLLRFLDIDIKQDMDAVLTAIENRIDSLMQSKEHPPAPLKGGIKQSVTSLKDPPRESPRREAGGCRGQEWCVLVA